MQDNKITSKVKPHLFLLLVIGGFLFLLLGGHLIKMALFTEYIEIPVLILGGISLAFSFAAIISIFYADTIVLNQSKLSIYSLFGWLKKSIFIEEIKSYMLIKKGNKDSYWIELTLYADNFSYKLNSESHTNFEQLRLILTHEKIENSFAKKIYDYKRNCRLGISYTIGGALFLLVLLSLYYDKDLRIEPTSLHTFTATVASTRTIEKERKSKKSFRITISEIPDFEFIPSGSSYEQNEVDNILENIQKNDVVQIAVQKETYQKKILKEVPLDFWDKHFNYNKVVIYGLIKNGNNYLDLSRRNRQVKSDRTSFAMYLFLGFSLFLVLYGLYLILFIKKPNQESHL